MAGVPRCESHREHHGRSSLWRKGQADERTREEYVGSNAHSGPLTAKIAGEGSVSVFSVCRHLSWRLSSCG